MDNIILHIDINNCFASIEIAENPQLRGKAMIVCGSKEDRHGIVLAKSEEAKYYGVKTAETIWQAQQKCPNLVLVPPRLELYAEYSRKARDIYQRYTSQVEPFGIDECWLDITHSLNLFGTPENIAEKIIRDINFELGITVSVGIAYSKVMAKLASDLAGVNEVKRIDRQDFATIVAPLPIIKLLGVGQKTANKLARFGIDTIGKLADAPMDFIQQQLGVCGRDLCLAARGELDSQVAEVAVPEPVKSISSGCTCRKDLLDDQEVYRVFLDLAEEVSQRLHEENIYATGVQIVVKNNQLISYQKQSKLPSPSRSTNYLAEYALKLFKQSYMWYLPVRALTLRVINLVDRVPQQLSFLREAENYERQNRLDEAIYQLNQQLGTRAVVYATQQLENKLPQERYTFCPK